MIKTYTYKLYNNDKYLSKYNSWIGKCRFVYNLAKETKETAFSKGQSFSKFDLMKQLTELKQDCEWLKDVNAQTLQAVIERLDNSYQNYFRKLKNGEIVKGKAQYIAKKQKNGGIISEHKLRNFGKPKWAKKDEFQTITFTQNVKETDRGFYLPKFGEVKVFNKKRKINGNIKQAKLTKKADGLYLMVIVEEEGTKRENQSFGTVALDMGIKYFCATSDGEFIDNPKFLNKQLKELRRQQRKLNRKYNNDSKTQSKGYYKQKEVVARLHKKVCDARNDFLHKLSTQLSNQYDTIIVEDLDIRDMVRNKLYSRHILDCSWGKFFELLEQKTNLVKVNPAYSSQQCNNCGHTCKENRITQSLFECVSCGYTENADYQATLNLLKRGHSLLELT